MGAARSLCFVVALVPGIALQFFLLNKKVNKYVGDLRPAAVDPLHYEFEVYDAYTDDEEAAWQDEAIELLPSTKEEKEYSSAMEAKQDKHEYCEGWAAAGECQKNPDYMLESCAKSCSMIKKKEAQQQQPHHPKLKPKKGALSQHIVQKLELQQGQPQKVLPTNATTKEYDPVKQAFLKMKNEIAQTSTVKKSIRMVPKNMTTRLPKPTHYTPYYAIADRIEQSVKDRQAKLGQHIHNSYSAYSQAQKKPVPHRKLCKETCCVEAVAISLDQDDRKITNTEDGKDMADLWIQHHHYREEHLKYLHNTTFQEDFIPCLVPGTIIQIDNHQMSVKYFWHSVRPKIKVPFVLVTTASDDNSPSMYPDYLADPLLIKWYGTNPWLAQFGESPDEGRKDKFRPMHLGLSYQHPQSKYLEPYLDQNQYRNPFTNMDRFDLAKYPLDWKQDIFVHFGIEMHEHRQRLWKVLCPKTTKGSATISCNQETNTLETTEIYADMSKYRFGISPTGAGWDCYRTYELLLLGVIPIIPERAPDSHQLYEGFPVIHMANLDEAKSQSEFIKVIENYVASPEFQKANFTAAWERMFTRYQRRQLLKDTGRDADIITNRNGREFYQGYRYTTTTPRDNVFCEAEGSCVYKEIFQLTKWELPIVSQEEQEWLTQWKRLATPALSAKPKLRTKNNVRAQKE